MDSSLEKVPTLQLGVIALCTGLVGLVLLKALTKPKLSAPLPPGPPRDPILGNLRHYSADDPYKTFCQWAKTYGDVVYARLPGVHMVVINQLDLIQELFTKRANNNNGRTVGYMARELADWKWLLTIRRPDEDFHEIRRMLRQGLGPHSLGKDDSLVYDCSKELIVNLTSFGGDPTTIVSNLIGRLIIQLAYGEEIYDSLGGELVRFNLEGFDLAAKVVTTFWMVDVLPFLRFLPSWIPGAKFQRLAQHARGVSESIRTLPWQKLIDLHKSGSQAPSLGNRLLEKYGPSENLNHAISVLYLGGVDTTTNAIVSFLLMMFLFPEVAKKVHAEITDQIGEERLLLISDRTKLPYTEAVWKESLRWKPWIPYGFPHTSQSEQTINGYLIPKGSIIFGNIGFILTDPAVWGDPEVFRPERFLTEHNPNASDLPNPSQLIFGFGTRICPGLHLADRVAFHMAITTISLFEILPLKGSEVLTPDTIRYSTATVQHPLGFECQFVPRGHAAQNLISSIELEKRQ